MKAYTFISRFLIVLIIIVSVLVLRICYHNSTFVKDNYVKYTSINEFVVKFQYYDNHQSLIETIIPPNRKEMLIDKYQFSSNLSLLLAGKITCPFIIERPDFMYCIFNNGHGYGYILFALEKNGNVLQVFENYGD